MSPCTIRHAHHALTWTDVSTILELIKELADYEKELSAVQATEETLASTIAFAPSDSNLSAPGGADLTTPARPARCLLAFDESNTPVGMALYFYSYSTWRARHGIWLEDLYVRQTERGKGYGKKLLSALAREVVETGGARLEWSVLKWNEPSIQFYRSIGAQSMDEWVTMRVDGDTLPRLAGLGAQ
ncbi:N-acetyltransferase ats1 [Verticillium alfalfae VaMs.102]|uniref:N-acetyltransferase ats1 n=1 Tax=Verticillium alfalfae (strain VaMs.102 / ATCC MYA-4576 / FGSC 10136) TaxID=526221 RepID=C9SUD3_VERA1|nr:N-acetyltransferase ats1 [Verticillium alfalfae VaMs.102]EEY22444.1 N-acetyltransferase ats1 [Verticillium alfalfae VaMs.102]